MEYMEKGQRPKRICDMCSCAEYIQKGSRLCEACKDIKYSPNQDK